LLAHGRWFTPASSTTKTGRHDIAEILLKVALNAKKKINQSINQLFLFLTGIYCFVNTNKLKMAARQMPLIFAKNNNHIL
jgi:hypothetical protein